MKYFPTPFKAAAFIAFLLFANMLQAQTATVRGFVYDKDSGEPAMFTNVYLKGTTIGASTDVNGYFSITRIAAGSYDLMVTFIGFDTLSAPIVLKNDEILNKKLFITKKAVTLQTFDVSAEKQEAREDVQMSVTKLTPKEIKQIPTVGGEPDLAQYLQILPGVIFTGDQGGQLYIRGGSPIQNKVLLDGMVIYNPFHSIGLFSVFDTDVIRSADIYTGGFSAEYGGRISSVMDITTREGNKKRYGGKIAASPFVSRLMLEGPIKKSKEIGGGNSSFLVSARTSYLESSSKVFYTYVDTNGLPYNFTDLYGKVSFTADNGSKLNLFGFKFTDNVTYRQLAKYNWDSFGTGASFVLVPGNSPVLIDGLFAFSNYDITLKEAELKPRNSSIGGFNAGLNFTYFIAKDEIKYGLEMLGFKTDFNFFNSVGRFIQQVENTTELAAYIRYKKLIGKKLVLEPSFRVQYYASLSETSPEPRLGLKYNITDKVRFKFAGGLYSQNLISATSDRDVVNLFYGFLSGPDNLPSKFDGKEVTSKLQKARHALGGFEFDLPFHFSLNVEGYLKDFNQLTNLNRDKLFQDTPDNAQIADQLKKDFIIETGLAKGIDFLLKYNYRKVSVWAVYSLGYVDRYDGVREYVPHFDRRHNVNLVTTYTFGKNLDWEVNARWNFGSGFPFTKTAGFYEFLNFSNGITTDYTTENGMLEILYGDLNKGRLPYYHRLDLSVKKTISLAKNSSLDIIASVVNTYDRQNIFYFDRVLYQRVDQLPILPSIGATLSF